LLKNNKTFWKEENSFHLTDASDSASLSILFSNPTIATANYIIIQRKN
jgi:hypothetical protein